MSDGARFFQCEDGDGGGATYTVVARDLDHAKQILAEAGMEFDSDYGKGLRPQDRGARLTWTEITTERAAQISIHDEDNPGPRNLSQYPAGIWFCSEF